MLDQIGQDGRPERMFRRHGQPVKHCWDMSLDPEDVFKTLSDPEFEV